jgi:hypothetical protein
MFEGNFIRMALGGLGDCSHYLHWALQAIAGIVTDVSSSFKINNSLLHVIWNYPPRMVSLVQDFLNISGFFHVFSEALLISFLFSNAINSSSYTGSL